MSTLASQEFTANGTFTPASGVSAVWVTMIGGGGAAGWTGNNGFNRNGGGGGGAGEFVRMRLVPVTSGVGVTVTIGAGGVLANHSASHGEDGSPTSFGSTVIANGGWGGWDCGVQTTHVTYHQPSPIGANPGGDGGGCWDQPGGGLNHDGTMGDMETPRYFGGSSGAGGTADVPGDGMTGGTAEAVPGPARATRTGGGPGGVGGGGSSSPWGIGGKGGDNGTAGHAALATAYGAGGGGAGGNLSVLHGTDGIAGYCAVFWTAP